MTVMTGIFFTNWTSFPMTVPDTSPVPGVPPVFRSSLTVTSEVNIV